MKLDIIINTPCELRKDNDINDEVRNGHRSFQVRAIKCKDGTRISVQANQFTYCNPRDNQGPWTQVECGYPSVKPQESMMKYVEDPDKPTKTVYGYVPIEVVREFVELHGGEVE